MILHAFFGLSIGSRINFLPFVFAAIIFLKLDYKIDYMRYFIYIKFFVGGLFYLTVDTRLTLVG